MGLLLHLHIYALCLPLPSYLLLDELAAHCDGRLDGVGVHALGGVEEVDLAAQLQTLHILEKRREKEGLIMLLIQVLSCN